MSKEVIVTVKADTKDAQTNVKDLNKDLKETKGDLSGVENMADKVTGGLISGFKGSVGAIKGVVKGFKTLRGAIIATGIGALVLVVSSLMAAFTDSEEGANKFSKILKVLGTVVDNVLDLFADFGEAIISAFENPQEALMSFVNLLKNQVINRINGLMELIPALGKAVQLVFSGDFSEAGKVATNAVGKVVLGVEDVTEKIQAATQATKEFIAENIEEAKKAAGVADMRAKAAKLERELLVQRSKLESEIANLRLKSRQEEEFSSEERKQALLDAQKLEDKLLQKETEVLKLRRDAQVEENTFARSNIENLDKEAEAIAAVNRIAATRANQQRTTQRELNTLNKQIQAENKRIADEKKAIDDAALKRTEAALKSENNLAIKRKRFDAEQIEDELEKLERLKEIDLEEQEIETARLQDVINNANAGTQARIDAEIAYNEFLEQSRQKNITRGKEISNEKLKNQKEELQTLEGYWDNFYEWQKKNEKDKEQYIADAKQSIQANSLMAMSNLIEAFANQNEKNAERTFNLQKGLAIVETLINTSVAIMKTAKETTDFTPPQALRIGNMVAMGVAGAAQVAAIATRKFNPSGTTGGGNVPTPKGGAATSPTQPPSFNVVGQSGFNQVAGALGQQQPVQAFVVSGDVTTAQQLQNNTITQATF